MVNSIIRLLIIAELTEPSHLHLQLSSTHGIVDHETADSMTQAKNVIFPLLHVCLWRIAPGHISSTVEDYRLNTHNSAERHQTVIYTNICPVHVSHLS